MKDPKRIDTVLNLIKKIWKKHPHLRLMQLLGDCFVDIPNFFNDKYFTKNDVLEKNLKRFYKEK